jgi:hypothetical protein
MKKRTLTKQQKDDIFERRGCISDKDGKRHPRRLLDIHHKNRNPEDNRPENLRILTKDEHIVLHRRYG